MGDLTTSGPTLPPLKDLKAKWGAMSWGELRSDLRANFNRSVEAHYLTLNQLAYIDETQRWKEDGRYATFGEFLYQEFNMAEVRFRRLRLLAGSFEQRDYDRWGAERLARVSRTANPVACLEELNAAWEEEGRRPSRRRIKAIIRKHQPPPLPAPREPVVESVEVLRRENARLKQEVRALRLENGRQAKELRELREQVRTMRADIRDHYQRLGKVPDPPKAPPPAA